MLTAQASPATSRVVRVGGANSERAERDVSDVTEWRCPELYSGKEASEGHNVLHSKL